MKYNNKKYKVVNAKVNKQLINDELELEPIRSKCHSVLQLILDRLDEHSKRFDKVETTLVEHGKLLRQHGEAITNIKSVLERHDAMFKEHG
jgi:hypothetical protein